MRLVHIALSGSGALAALGLASVASAAFHVVLSVSATNAATGVPYGSQTWDLGDVDAPDFHWALAAPVTLGDPDVRNQPLLRFFSIDLRDDATVATSFDLRAGTSGTIFTVHSAVVSFAAMSSPMGCASADISVADGTGFGTPGSYALTGLEQDGKCFSALYNTSSSFAGLISSAAGPISAGGVALADTLGTPSAMVAIPGTLTSIESKFQFTLSAGDSATGSSQFEVVPSPGAASLIGLGVLIGAQRRRQRQCPRS